MRDNHDAGILVQGSDATITATVIRDTQSPNAAAGGHGIHVQDCPNSGERADVSVRESLVDHNERAGIIIMGSDATIDATVVRDTQPNSAGERGAGLYAVYSPTTGARTNATVHASLLQGNHEVGVYVTGADATIESTIVRNTLPAGSGIFGRGIIVHYESIATEGHASALIRGSLVDENHEVGLFVDGADATIESTVVRSTLPDSEGHNGWGIGVQNGETQKHSIVTVHGSLVTGNHDWGVALLYDAFLPADGTADLLVLDSVVEDTQPSVSDGAAGGGLGCSHAAMTLVHTLMRGNRVAAVAAWDCVAEVTGSRFEDVLAGHFFAVMAGEEPAVKYENVGDGLLAAYGSTVAIADTRIERCVRAGVLFDDSSGALSRVTSTSNRFGLTVQGDPIPTYDDTCSFAGNTEQDLLSDGALPVPEAPPMPTH